MINFIFLTKKFIGLYFFSFCVCVCAVMCSSVPSPACEPLVWSWTELPTDGQTVALLASVLENPQDFYCCINSPTGIVVSSACKAMNISYYCYYKQYWLIVSIIMSAFLKTLLSLPFS